MSRESLGKVEFSSTHHFTLKASKQAFRTFLIWSGCWSGYWTVYSYVYWSGYWSGCWSRYWSG